MSLAAFLGIGSAVAGVSALLRLVGLDAAHRRLLRELQEGTTRAIDTLQHGEVARVVGKVEARSQVIPAPLSGRPCVAWEVSVWQPISLRAWRRCASAGDHVPFAILDGTGRAAVTGKRTRSYSVVDHEERFESTAALSERAQAYVDARGLSRLLEVGMITHFKESVLSPDELAVVVGHVHRVDDRGGRTIYRESAALAEIELRAPMNAAVLFSDAPEALETRDMGAVSRIGPRIGHAGTRGR